jgi:putative hemolysin
MFDFEVKIAQDEKEIEQALRLRFEVFKLEMASSKVETGESGLETDIYDRFCDHLIVIDKTINKVVGTYRFMLDSSVDKKIGFYSERLFNIKNIKRLSGEKRILELGRSCIHKDYRSRPVINLLWNGIAKYVKDNNVRYLFGPVRLYTNDPNEISIIFKFLKGKYYSGPEYRVYPKPENKLTGLNENIKLENPKEIFHQLPPLVKGYLRAGVLICGLPAIDSYLTSVVIFIVLDTEKLSYSYKQHYLY